MTKQPQHGDAAQAAAAERKARQAEALRANLRRRKDQARAREDEVPPPKGDAARLQAVLDFWFGPADHPEYGAERKAWFQKDPAFDEEIRRHFARDLEVASAGGFDHLMHTPLGALALVIIFDQFPRNLFRGKPEAFARDARARAVALNAVEAGFDAQLLPVQRMFLYLPFEHSEDLTDQERCIVLCHTMPQGSLRDYCIDYARRHGEIIRRFGRFPHRNAALGRLSTSEEAEFLQQPGSSF